MSQSKQYKLLKSDLDNITDECTKIENEISRLQSLLDNNIYQKLSIQLSTQENIYNEKIRLIDDLVAKIKQLEVAREHINDRLNRSKNEPDMTQGTINSLIDKNNSLTSQITDLINKTQILEKEIKFFDPEFEAQINNELTKLKKENKKLLNDIQQIRRIKILYYLKRIFTLDVITNKTKELIALCLISTLLFISSIANTNAQYIWGNITSFIGLHSLAHIFYVKSYLGGNSVAYAKSMITDDDKTDFAIILLKNGDYAHGVEILSKIVNTNNIAQLELYKILSNDAITGYDKSLINVPESELLVRAAFSGNIEAQMIYASNNPARQYEVGMWYKNNQQQAEAEKWFKKAAQSGYLEAQEQYAGDNPNRMLEVAHINKMLNQNTSTNANFIKKAALSGNIEAQHLYADNNADNSFQIGMLYKSGQLGVNNIKSADSWLLNAAKLGNLDAQLEYANSDPNKLYQMAILNNVGTKRYNSMIKKAAELGSKQAQEVYVANSTSRMYEVGMWYRNGLVGDDKYAGDDYLYRAAIRGSKKATEEYLIGPANNKYKYGLFLTNQRRRFKFGYELISNAAADGDDDAKEWMSNHANWFFQRWWWGVKSIF